MDPSNLRTIISFFTLHNLDKTPKSYYQKQIIDKFIFFTFWTLLHFKGISIKKIQIRVKSGGSKSLKNPGQTEFVYEPIILMGASLPQNILPDFVYGEYSLRLF